jgi:DNA-binding PadR family transcriptional regulator
MALTPSSYVVLGMLNIGARSGYEIKRFMELSARFFWAISPVQIYPELKRLEAAGLIRGRDGQRGGRRRRLFEMTPQGRETLRDWLRNEEKPTVEWRDKGLLKLFFADALKPDEGVEQVRALRERAERLARTFRTEIVPAAEATSRAQGTYYSALVARFGLEFNEWVTTWCLGVERELAEAPKPAMVSSKPRAGGTHDDISQADPL